MSKSIEDHFKREKFTIRKKPFEKPFEKKYGSK